MDTIAPRRKDALGSWRRLLFITWVAAAIIAALAAMVGGPLTSTDGVEGTAPIALISPIAMAVFAITGIAWLIVLMFSRRDNRASK